MNPRKPTSTQAPSTKTAARGDRPGTAPPPTRPSATHQLDLVADATGAPAAAWTTDDPITAARQVLAATEPGDWVLIKASRGMRLERVVAALKELAV